MIGKIVLLLSINGGIALGWKLGAKGGIMGSYLAAVSGAALGLVVGRRWQKWLEGDE
jgi:outer membrane lipoprotein SlyB